jgi:hypothetical protein
MSDHLYLISSPPEQKARATCRLGPMSTWRLNGYVQDSDEEDELSQIESQDSRHATLLDTRVERVDRAPEARGADKQQSELSNHHHCGNAIRAETLALESGISPKHPTSPTTPAVNHVFQQEPTDSPDPLQSSPTPKSRLQTLPPSSQLLGSPTRHKSPPVLAARSDDSQTIRPHTSPAIAAPETISASEILERFGIPSLFNDSDDDSPLSDVPSDMDIEPPPSAPTSYASPHRRTAVQVVIPSLTALREHIAEEETRRQFRPRTVDQLHPYRSENKRYRMQFESRGLKPVPRERSLSRKASYTGADTQEKEFDPNASPLSSPIELEIPVSTPTVESLRRGVREQHTTTRNISNPRRRKTSAARHDLHAVKRRQLDLSKRTNIPATQTVAKPSKSFETSPVPRNIWSVPPDSPPYSSSPPHNRNEPRSHRHTGSYVTTPIPNLPTPSNSSMFQDEIQLVSDSDDEPAPRSIRRKSGVRPPARTIPSGGSSSDSEAHGNAPGRGDHELKRVGKKIKGVLPASWLRIDQQAQEKRTVRTREKERARLDNEPVGPQRGIAQKVSRRVPQPVGRTSVSPSRQNVILLSDESEAEPEIHQRPEEVQNDLEDAIAMASIFDSRYAHDDDLSDMEYDKLPLPTFGGAGSSRKRQIKITDSFQDTKRMRVTTSGVRNSHQARKALVSHSRRQKHVEPRKPKCFAPPALSIADVILSPSEEVHKTPQFVRIAQRQARRRSDQARQSPNNKFIRLYNLQDTEDANATLVQWRRGIVSPSRKFKSRQQSNKLVSANFVGDIAQLTLPPHTSVQVDSEPPTNEAARSDTVNGRPRERKKLSNSLSLFQRLSPTVTPYLPRKTKSIPVSVGPRISTRRRAIQPRTAQLEGDEKDLNPHLRTRAFANALRQVDQEFRNEQPAGLAVPNPQVARFLTDGSDVMPSAQENDIEGIPEVDARQKRQPRKRLVRKTQAHRIDVDAREYRQPVEPAVQHVFEAVATQVGGNQCEQSQSTLEGLSPFGTEYPTTFDVAPLKSDIYFHSSTFIGSDDFRRALLIGTPGGRDLDQRAGYCSISYANLSIKCGPWNDDTHSKMCELAAMIWLPLDGIDGTQEELFALHETASANSSNFLRSLVAYIQTHASFPDPIDRRPFVARVKQLLFLLHDRLDLALSVTAENATASCHERGSVRALAYLLVAAADILQIAQHPIVENPDKVEVTSLIKKTATSLLSHVIKRGVPALDQFLDKNRRHLEREKGVQNDEILVESIVICMHVLDGLDIPDLGYWDIISKELCLLISRATHVRTFEQIWATIFTLLPFTAFDLSGIPDRTRISSFSRDNWTSVRDILKRLFGYYLSTHKENSSSLSDYIRANLVRCHVLIQDWHWKKPEQMLNVTLDFFGKMGLQSLSRERNLTPATFLHTNKAEGSLCLGHNDGSFLVSLKCLALGLQGMADAYPEKKVRSFVIRRVPNHGRDYPKDQPLEQEALVALQNHHDLLCTLYWAAPPSCRPRLELIRNLVSHESSHREACRLSVFAWTNLTAFQISSDEPYAATQQFALWHKDIMHHTLKQYQLAKTEAEDYLKSGVLVTGASTSLVRQTMEKNQEQVIATLRDCVTGLKRAIQNAHDPHVLPSFLADADIEYLLELPHLEDRRLVRVIKDVLALFFDYDRARKASVSLNVSQQLSDESQDYGEFPDLDDLEDTNSKPFANVSPQTGLGFAQAPLWRLLSNAFGAEASPDKSLLEDCVDTWILVAKSQIMSGERSWSHYIDSFSHVSWKQLRHTEQTRRFYPYFLASLIKCDSAAYVQHRHEFLTSLLLCLVDRESLLGFQHRLLYAVVQIDPENPLLKNLPFIRDEKNGTMDVTVETLRSRRLAVLSSMLSNMRDEVHDTLSEDPSRASVVRRTYASMLKDLMARMKNNYEQLQQGESVTGAYVEFVQRIVQFLTQYTSEICPILPFFTDSVAFPLPTTDPTYVIGRLCGYAPKAGDLRTAKQLAIFIQTVAQQAAADNQEPYLVHQLTTALCIEDPAVAERTVLRSVLCQGIFPAYIELAFASQLGFMLANPILQSLPMVFDTITFDLRVAQQDSVSSVLESVVSVLHAFIRSTEQLKGNSTFFRQPYTLCALSHLFEITISSLRILDYILDRTVESTCSRNVPLKVYLRQFSLYVEQMVNDVAPLDFPSYLGDACANVGSTQSASLLMFARNGVKESLKTNWRECQDTVWFGQGQTEKEVSLRVGSLEDEQVKLSRTILLLSSAL